MEQLFQLSDVDSNRVITAKQFDKALKGRRKAELRQCFEDLDLKWKRVQFHLFVDNRDSVTRAEFITGCVAVSLRSLHTSYFRYLAALFMFPSISHYLGLYRGLVPLCPTSLTSHLCAPALRVNTV